MLRRHDRLLVFVLPSMMKSYLSLRERDLTLYLLEVCLAWKVVRMMTSTLFDRERVLSLVKPELLDREKDTLNENH